MQDRLRILGQVYDAGSGPSFGINAVKYALSLMEICSAAPADPLLPLDESAREQVRGILEALGLIKVGSPL